MNPIECLDELILILFELKHVDQHHVYHPEGNVYDHSIQVFEEALKHTSDPELLLSAIFHDIGKLVDNNNHANISVELLSQCSFITEKVIFLVQNHLRVAYLLSGDMKNKSKIDYLTKHKYFDQLLKLREFDVNGRKVNYKSRIKDSDIRNLLVDIIRKIQTIKST